VCRNIYASSVLTRNSRQIYLVGLWSYRCRLVKLGFPWALVTLADNSFFLCMLHCIFLCLNLHYRDLDYFCYPRSLFLCYTSIVTWSRIAHEYSQWGRSDAPELIWCGEPGASWVLAQAAGSRLPYFQVTCSLLLLCGHGMPERWYVSVQLSGSNEGSQQI